MNRTLIFLLFTAVSFSITSCSSLFDKRESLVKNKLTQQLNTESQGALSLTSFTKTNGAEQNGMGFQAYQLEFNATITASRFCIKPGNPFAGYFENFQVILQEPTDAWARQNLSNAQRLQPGRKVELKCNCILIKKDNGWEAQNISIESYRFL